MTIQCVGCPYLAVDAADLAEHLSINEDTDDTDDTDDGPSPMRST